MPNRVIKDSIKSSAQIDSLTWFEEVVFYRLMVSADDYGCFDGRPIYLKNALFPTKDNVTKKAVEDAIQRLASVGLLRKYEVNGMPYLFFPTWEKHQRIRNKHRKYPLPPLDSHLTADCGQMTADCQSESNPIQSESESNPKKEEAPAATFSQVETGFGPDLQAAFEDWLSYKAEKRQAYKPKGLTALISEIRANAQKYGESAVVALIRECMAANWQGVIFDRLAKKYQRQGTAEPTQHEKSYDLDEIESLSGFDAAGEM